MSWKSIWAVDFEFAAIEGENPRPLCVVAHDLLSGQRVRRWLAHDEVQSCPYGTGPDDLFLAYYASAEIGCHLELGWPVPQRIIDLCAEFKLKTSGLDLPNGRGLVGALLHYGLNGSFDAREKKSMQELAAGGGPYTSEDRVTLLDYCESDVAALSSLWSVMSADIDTPRALIRGRYMASLAAVERNGVPVDSHALGILRANWENLKISLIREVDAAYGVFAEDGRFNLELFETYLGRRGIPWPRTPHGRLSLADEVFKEQTRLRPELRSLRELRLSLSGLKLFGLSVGSDSRNRTLLGAFGSKTGRNQPSNTRFIFGPATWVRHLIKPQEGRALAYIDYEQQEFAAAAALSGDKAMLEAYHSGDPYLAFARMAGAVPPNATKSSHPMEREAYKICALAVQYGMGPEALANAIGHPPVVARELLAKHKRTFPQCWRWGGDIASTAAATRRLTSTFGWRLNITPNTKPTTIANWPCQAAGAEMLRLAIIGAVERGIRVCAPVHDALLIEADAEDIEEAVAVTREQMGKASRAVLYGTTVSTDVKIVRHPDRYKDQRGVDFWGTLQKLLPTLASGAAHSSPPEDTPVTIQTGGMCMSLQVPVTTCARRPHYLFVS